MRSETPLDLTEPTDPILPFLTIQEMARQSGLSEHTLRYYERIGLLTPVPRDGSSGHRRYPADTIRRIETLACLRGTGMSIDAMRSYLRLSEQGASAASEQKALFIAHRNALEDEMERMKKRLAYLAGKVAYWEAVEAGDTVKAGEIAAVNQALASSLAQWKEKI